jgi:hypothetical protein
MSFRLFWIAVVFVCLPTFAHAGYIEICKDANPVGSLSGLFSFTVAGQSGTFSTPVGACTPAFQLPDGPATITEVPDASAMFFSVDTFPVDRLISFDATTESAVVEIVEGDISTQTAVTFTNSPATVITPVTGIPEPGTVWLFGLGLTFWVVRRNLMRAGQDVGRRSSVRWPIPVWPSAVSRR